MQDLDEDVEGMQSTIYFLQQELRKTKEALAELQQEKSLPNATPLTTSTSTTTAMPTTNNENNVKGDDCNNRTGSGEFRTENQSDRLTNGNHSTSSVICGNRTTNQSSKVIEPQKSDNNKDPDKRRTNHDEASSDSSEVLKFERRDVPDETDNEVNGLRKRTYDEDSNDSDKVPVVKKNRRGSEISLDYNEDELCLINGESKTEDR